MRNLGWPPFFKIADVDSFFIAVKTALAGSRTWRFHERGSLGPDQFLTANYVGEEFQGKDLWFALCSFGNEPSRVQLTLHATRWEGHQCGASDAQYADAEQLSMPVFRGASRLLQRRLKLSRPRSHKRRKGLKGNLGRLFTSFCAGATNHWSGGKLTHLHPTDYERFFEFICATHQGRSTLAPGEVHHLLKRAGFDDEIISELVGHFTVGRRLLAVRAKRRGVDVWNPWNGREDRKRWRTLRASQREIDRAN